MKTRLMNDKTSTVNVDLKILIAHYDAIIM